MAGTTAASNEAGIEDLTALCDIEQVARVVAERKAGAPAAAI